MKRLILCASLAAGLAAAGTPPVARAQSAETAADPAHLSLAAGYKAAFTCSATFNAGRSLEQIAGDELNRIYPDYRDAFETLPDAVIDQKAKTVSVRFADGFAPRVAAWRSLLGCVQLPSGADDLQSVRLPRIPPELAAEIQALRMATDPNDPNKLRIAALPIVEETPAPVARVVDAAFDRKTYGDGTETTAVLVMRDGVILAERYREGFDAVTPQRTWSVAKSIAASVIGAAVHDGVLTVAEPARLKAWLAPGDPRASITIENLLHMASGLDSSPAGNRTDDVYFGGGRIVDHAVDRRLVAAPGERWRYANNDTMIAMRSIRERMNDDGAYLAYPHLRLLSRIGMTTTFPETDWNGDFVFSSQVWTTARDLARLGMLYLNDGVWQDERILPENWARYVATPAPAQPGARGNGEARPGYGAQFWLFDDRHGLPEGTYAAMGNRGQYLFIVPERNIIIVRRGFDDNGGARFDVAAFVRDALAVIE